MPLNQSRVFDIQGEYSGIKCHFGELCQRHWYDAAQGAAYVQNAGGGILISDVLGGTVILTNLDITNNQATGYGGGQGANNQPGQMGQQALGGGSLIGGPAMKLIVSGSKITNDDARAGQVVRVVVGWYSREWRL